MFLQEAPLQSLLADAGFNTTSDSLMVDSLANLSQPFPDHAPEYRLPQYSNDMTSQMTQHTTPPPPNHLQHSNTLSPSNAYGMFMTPRADDVTTASVDSNEQQQQQTGSESSPIATPETKYSQVLQHQAPYPSPLGDSLTSYMNYAAGATTGAPGHDAGDYFASSSANSNSGESANKFSPSSFASNSSSGMFSANSQPPHLPLPTSNSPYMDTKDGAAFLHQSDRAMTSHVTPYPVTQPQYMSTHGACASASFYDASRMGSVNPDANFNFAFQSPAHAHLYRSDFAFPFTSAAVASTRSGAYGRNLNLPTGLTPHPMSDLDMVKYHQYHANVPSTPTSTRSSPNGDLVDALPPPKMKENMLCAVCGDNAACQHYGVRTCEGSCW